MSFVQIAEAKMRQTVIDNEIRRVSDFDSFVELSPLSLNAARQNIKNLFVNNPKDLVIVGPLTLTITIGNFVQIGVLLYDQKYKGPAYTPTSLGKDVAQLATWLTDPTPTTVLSVVRGKITGLVAGTVEVYAKFGDIESNRMIVTVV